MRRIGLIVLMAVAVISIVLQISIGGWYWLAAISCAGGVLVLGPWLQSSPSREAHLTEDLPDRVRSWYPHPTAVEMEALTWLHDHGVAPAELQQWMNAGLSPALLRSAILTPDGDRLPPEEALRVVTVFESSTNLTPDDPDSVIGTFRHLDLLDEESAAYGHTLARWAALPSKAIADAIRGIDVRNHPAHDDLAAALTAAEAKAGISYSVNEYQRTVEVEV